MNKRLNNKKLVVADKNGLCIPRCYWRKAKCKKSTSVLIKCGDCDEKVEIHYDNDWLEINGVIASARWWKQLFEYLMREKW